MTYLLKRKKFTFKSIANNIKGFIRAVSGKPPLKLYACVDTNSVIIYRITGKGVGDYDENTGKYKIPVKTFKYGGYILQYKQGVILWNFISLYQKQK